MRHRPLENVLEHIEHLVKAGFKDIRFITPDSLAYEIVQSLATAVEMITGQPRLEGSGPACDGWMFMSEVSQQYAVTVSLVGVCMAPMNG